MNEPGALPPIAGVAPQQPQPLGIGSGIPDSFAIPRTGSMGLPGRPAKDPERQAARASRAADDARLQRLLPRRSKDERYEVYPCDPDGRVKRGAKPVLEMLGSEMLEITDADADADPQEIIEQRLGETDVDDGFYLLKLVDPKGRLVRNYEPLVLTVGDVEAADDEDEPPADEDELDLPVAGRRAPPPPPAGFNPAAFAEGARQDHLAQQQKDDGLVNILGKVLEASMAPKADNTTGLMLAMLQSQQERDARMAEDRRREDAAREERQRQYEERQEERRRQEAEAARRERDDAARREREHWQTLLAAATTALAPFLPKIVDLLFHKREGFDPATQALIETLKAAGEKKGSESVMLELMQTMMKASSEMQMQQMSTIIKQSSDVSGALIGSLMDRTLDMIKRIGKEEKPEPKSVVSEVVEGLAAVAPVLMAQQQAGRPQVPPGMPRRTVRPPALPPQQALAPQPADEPPVAEVLPTAAQAAEQTPTRPYEPRSAPVRIRDSLGAIRALAEGRVPRGKYWALLERLRHPQDGLPADLLAAVVDERKDAVISGALQAVQSDGELMAWIVAPENAAFVEHVLADLRLSATGRITAEAVQAADARLVARLSQAEEAEVVEAVVQPEPPEPPARPARARRPRPGEVRVEGVEAG